MTIDSRVRNALLVVAAAVLVACGGDARTGELADASSGAADSGSSDATVACERSPAAANRARKVVVSHPYGDGATQTQTYEVFDLDTRGVLTAPGSIFEMGRALDGRIVFTSDGEVGIVAQDDGTLGIFRPSGGGIEGRQPLVIEAGYDAEGAFYATDVLMSDDGSTVYVLNGQWRNNGGGIYAVDITCDGTPRYLGMVTPSKLPWAMALASGGRALVTATDIGDSAAGNTVHLVDLAGDQVIAGANAFGQLDVIVSAATLTASGDYLLIGDGPGDRVAIVGIAGDTLSTPGVLADLQDPFSIVASPQGDGAIVVSGYGDAIFELDFDGDASQPFSIAGELSYSGANPQLPGSAVMIERGDLTGLVLVAENQGVRSVRFAGNGLVVDEGLTSLASGYTAVVGAIGVQP